MRNTGALLFAICALTACVLTACSGADSQSAAKLPTTEGVLARYQTIHIGKNKLRLPTIMLLSSTTNSSLTIHGGREVPIERVLSQGADDLQVSAIHISIDSYRQLQDYALDTHAYVENRFCGNLAAEWEKNQCRLGLYDGKNEFLPRHFDIVERGYLVSSNEQLFAIAGGGTSGGAAARMLLNRQSKPTIVCEPNQHPLCIAITPIRDDLIAVWAARREEMKENRKQVHWIMEQYLNR